MIAITEADAPAKNWTGKRVLTIEGKAAYEMSFWCGTCPLVFQRLEGATRTLSTESLTERLDDGLDACDHVVIEAIAINSGSRPTQAGWLTRRGRRV